MTILKNFNLLMLASLIATGIACGSGTSNQPTGKGGPDISPDTAASTDVAADAATLNIITDITATGESSVVIEPEANAIIEGSLDTGLSAAGGDATNIEELLPVVEVKADTGSTEITIDTTTDNNDEPAAEDDKAEKDSDAATAVVAAGTDPDETIAEIAAEETSTVKASDYELDSSSGKWFKETSGEITSDADAETARAKIAGLRAQIKEIMKKFADKEITRKDASAQIKALRAQIAELRAGIGSGGNKIEGIWTAWAYQDLFLKVNSGEPGWYRLVVVAKNHGTLPESYDRFAFNLTNENGDLIGSFKVKASDKVYNRGSIDFRLDHPAGSKLNIVWTNDYYVEGKYDANVSIKKVALKKIKDPKEKGKTSVMLKGDQYSGMDGRWFFDMQSAYTYWSGQEIAYTFDNLEEGLYEITIDARNHGALPLPKNYKAYNLIIESDYDSASMDIDASEKSWQKGTVTMSFPDGSTTIYITWTNDSYKEGEYDTNFMMKSIHVKKVEDSNLTAYLLKTKPGNKLFILAAFLMVSGVLLGIYLKNRLESPES